MKNAIAKYIQSKMNIEDEVQFTKDMLDMKFTNQEAWTLLCEINARISK